MDSVLGIVVSRTSSLETDFVIGILVSNGLVAYLEPVNIEMIPVILPGQSDVLRFP